MGLLPNWLLSLAGYDHGRERQLARASRDDERRELQENLMDDETRFREHMAGVARVPHVVVGTSASGAPYLIPLADLTSLPGWCTAGTGGGKSRLMGGFLEAVVKHGCEGRPVSVIVIDGKGETADCLLRSVASIAQGLPSGARASFLERVHTFNFFDTTYLPSWPLLARTPGIEVSTQADAVAEILTDVAQDALIGPRQRSTLSAVLAVAMEFDVPAAGLPWILSAPAEVAALAARSSLPSVRLELSRFAREPQGSIDGLIARLGTLLRAAPSIKAALSGPRPFDFATCFRPGSVTALSFAGADLGARAAVRAIGSLAVSAVANAAFDPRREVVGTTIIAVDEPQALMTSVTLGQFSRLITLGRSFGAGGVVLIHQGATQLPTELQTILNTNVALRVIGRSAERDVAAASEWLGRTGRVPRRRVPGAPSSSSSPFLSEGEEERFRIAEMGRLPQRNFLIADRRAAFAPRIVRASDYDPPRWSDIDPQVADAVRRGTAGFPRAELEVRVREIEEHAAARFAAGLGDEPRERGRRAAVPRTPDVVGQPMKAGRRGRVP